MTLAEVWIALVNAAVNLGTLIVGVWITALITEEIRDRRRERLRQFNGERGPHTN
jgi:hypothetical protein